MFVRISINLYKVKVHSFKYNINDIAAVNSDCSNFGEKELKKQSENCHLHWQIEC